MDNGLILYPANRLEDLALLFGHLLTQTRPGPLVPQPVIVESSGMQHWLSMQLAEQHGICMNLEFTPPGRFLWQLARRVLGEDRVPRESPYAREVLAWRIDRLLIEGAEDPALAKISGYWREGGQADPQRRFQLAREQADLFEQYLLFRPDWIDAWSRGERVPGLDDEWQSILWQRLVAELADHPLALAREAGSRLAEVRDRLPAQVCLFGINTLPPVTLAFLDRLARVVPVHLFHLNPCVDYWGDLASDRQRARARADQVRRWLASGGAAGAPTAEEETGTNPLLANLGLQGREFLEALTQLEAHEISAFDLGPRTPGEEKTSVLHAVQQDLLTLRDARLDPVPLWDDSIRISASHGALRELQALHDWLLHRFNADPTLTPRDVIILCPEVERYAPYIGAVFDTGGQADGETPRLPVAVSDRTPRDDNPLVAAFLELLQLPDSRFQVTRLLDLLRQPALQQRFGIAAEELPTLRRWLIRAAVHWGLDEGHKGEWLDGEGHPKFSWRWGLRRLLRGFASADEERVVGDELLLPEVEGGGAALLLGRLMQFVEQLEQYSRSLRSERTAAEWADYLTALKERFFATRGVEEGSDAEEILDRALGDLRRHAELAGCDYRLPLAVIRDWLGAQLSRPDSGNRFMTGQITFCSLEPMRSTPFRIVAILGLNDGEFPRQQIPRAFDLMAAAGRCAGDRSRQGDDRYLFLEALISAREHLYLSYQGADIKNGSERQPSLVLRELMAYLAEGYGWDFSGSETSGVVHTPLHPFSPRCFTGPEPGFDRQWFRLVTPAPARNNLIVLPPPEDEVREVDLEALVEFFDNPPKVFARSRLGLSLEQEEETIDDGEPFDADHLSRYKARSDLLAARLGGDDGAVAALRRRWILDGALPDGSLAGQRLDEWEARNGALLEALRESAADQCRTESFAFDLAGVRVTGRLQLQGDRVLLWRPTKVKAKDQLRLWLSLLCGQVAGLCGGALSLHDAKDEGKVERLELSARNHPEVLLQSLLESWRRGLQEPALVHAAAGLALCKAGHGGRSPAADEEGFRRARRAEWQKLFKQDRFGSGPLATDPYFRWFWPEPPEVETVWPKLSALWYPAAAALFNLPDREDQE